MGISLCGDTSLLGPSEVVDGGDRGGGAGCLGYWRRAAAPAADFTGFEAVEPIERDRARQEFGSIEVMQLFAAKIGGDAEARLGNRWSVATQVTSKNIELIM